MILIKILTTIAMATPSLTTTTKTVTAAGTAERLSATSSRYHMIVLQAECDNTGNIHIGGSSVDSSNGILLDACESFTFTGSNNKGSNIPFDLYEIWIDADTNGEGVKILGIKN